MAHNINTPHVKLKEIPTSEPQLQEDPKHTFSTTTSYLLYAYLYLEDNADPRACPAVAPDKNSRNSKFLHQHALSRYALLVP